MSRVVTAIALIGVVFVGTRSLAADSVNRPTMSKRQMVAQIIGCMKKRMSANKNSSYNEAMRACKDQIKRDNDDLPSGPLVASESAGKQ
jgi:hypothetical protein